MSHEELTSKDILELFKKELIKDKSLLVLGPLNVSPAMASSIEKRTSCAITLFSHGAREIVAC